MSVSIHWLYVVIPLCIIIVGVISYVWVHDIGIDAETYAKTHSCAELKHFLDTEGRKISENMFTQNIKKVYNEKNCDAEVKP